MSDPKEPLEIMREMYNNPQQVQSISYDEIASVYHSMRDDGRKIAKLERDIAELRLKRLNDYEARMDLAVKYVKLARQYACDCEKLCSEDLQDQDYCGWRAKQALE